MFLYKLKHIFIASFMSAIMFSGCFWDDYMRSIYNYDTYLEVKTLNGAIKRLADQLQDTADGYYIDRGTITITSFVDANKLEKTNLVGRTISESLFFELFKRGFKVTDFRGKDAISVNSKGEFYITRDVSRIKPRTPNTFVLAGTYSIVGNNIFISARIMDNKEGRLVSAARVLYSNEDCAIAYLCQIQEAKRARLQAQEDARIKLKLKIKKDVTRTIIPLPIDDMPRPKANTTKPKTKPKTRSRYKRVFKPKINTTKTDTNLNENLDLMGNKDDAINLN